MLNETHLEDIFFIFVLVYGTLLYKCNLHVSITILFSDVKSPHVCDSSCLGPLTFHCQTVGEKVTLSHGGRLAKRTPTTFKHGLLFSSRQVRIQEKIRLKVMRDLHNWNGVLRVGFTSVPPAARPLPLPPMAIPDLTSKPGYWAVPLDDSYCQEHSELEIWVSSLGTIYVSYNNSKYVKLHKGVDVSQPLWAMIDLYGNTSSICLLGQCAVHTTMICISVVQPV